MAVMVVVIITGGVMVVGVAVGVVAAMVITLRKGFKENPEKSSPQREGGFPLGFLMRKRVRMRVINALFNISPA